MLPAHALIGAPDAPRLAVICHGILGSGRNWRSFARRLVSAAPAWRLALVDLRNHGDSVGAAPPHTVAACAADLHELAAVTGQPEAIIGHSFGGKVALAYTDTLPPALRQTWVLDAAPGPITSPADEHEVSRVIAALRAIPQPLQRRAMVAELLMAQGFSAGLSRWMTTNLRRTDRGLVWRFDLDAVELMIQDYFRLDLWSVLELPVADLTIHLVQAERSDRWSEAALRRIEGLTGAVELHVLPDAGHWVHADNPEGLLAMMLPSLR